MPKHSKQILAEALERVCCRGKEDARTNSPIP